MPAALRIKLTIEEDKTLQELSLADNVPRRVKIRASLLSTSHRKKGSEIEEDIFCRVAKKSHMQGRSSNIQVEMTGEQ
ncbi:MAG: hypothetical protein KME52_26150, partial [Desmonostoc geniculatum HA4340-LM1]|nr:hypothetical protein [Desmonostoc geniculatum HA4340-LM1]